MIDKFTSKSGQGIIVYGQDKECSLTMAYKIVFNHIIDNASDTESSEHTTKHILANTYPNFMRIGVSPEKSDISIDETREIIKFLSQKPTLHGGRAVIIERAGKMSKNASNSILKTLEELPTDSIVVMTANSLQSILSTIRSRCIKIQAKSQKPGAYECANVLDYIERSIPNLDTEYIRRIVNLINSDYKGIAIFAKQNAETTEDFLNVLSTYYVYYSIKTKDPSAAEKTLILQSLAFQLKTAFPDLQSAMIAASMICSQ
ncbi:MAG: hypothetical protein LBL32_02305 [Holosporales bacterium]|jgi:DNA polymerase III delta prime subunit|nr:hypothetical protein [Holosporales bacterium]